MKLVWPLAFLLAIGSAAVGVRIQGLDGDVGLLEPAFYASTALSVALLVFLLVDYRREIGSKFRGSDLFRIRLATIFVGNLAVILLALGFVFAGVGFSVLTFAFFSHGTVASKETIALHAEWDGERVASEEARAAKADLTSA